MRFDKISAYQQLVNDRKACRACCGLTNPSVCNNSYDSDEIGPWSLWQGNLDADLMIVGQDWGDDNYFLDNAGHESQKKNPTNETLRALLHSIGIKIESPSRKDDGNGKLFFTNAILCLKAGGMQARVTSAWFKNCGPRFLRPSIEIVRPAHPGHARRAGV